MGVLVDDAIVLHQEAVEGAEPGIIAVIMAPGAGIHGSFEEALPGAWERLLLT